ncbi:hypothetical protein ZWY2020_004829 [Hordeum vulgare]|nr:hypothetical protein ZWY2020_025326 [Hordeum vulgare]KAI5000240.1 hypothetical protein ZWY2020_004829 [Hordeum vulgare]
MCWWRWCQRRSPNYRTLSRGSHPSSSSLRLASMALRSPPLPPPMRPAATLQRRLNAMHMMPVRDGSSCPPGVARASHLLLLRPSLDAFFLPGFTEDDVAASIGVTVQWFAETLSHALATSSPAIGLADAPTRGVRSAPWSLYVGLLQPLLCLLRLPPLPDLLLVVGLHFRKPSRFSL